MSEYVLAVGSLNREAPYFQGARGVGLSILAFDADTGHARTICEDRGVDNPTYLSVDAQTGCLYANSEVFGWHEGTITAYRFDPALGRLAYINKQPSLGSIAAYNSFDRDRRHLLVANYAMSPPGEGPDCAAVVYPIRQDGGLAAPISWVSHQGQGPNTERQERAHPHCIIPSPDGAFAIVADLGLDVLITYALGEDGRLSCQPVASTQLPPGSGPRHVVFHPQGKHALVICELDSTIHALAYASATGQFTVRSTVSAVPDEARSINHCSDIQLHPNGRYAYGGNRGHDSVTLVVFDPETSDLSVAGHFPCGGATPRNLAIDPTGRFLLVANQNSDAVSVFSIAADTGRLARAGADIPIGSPMCLKFFAT